MQGDLGMKLDVEQVPGLCAHSIEANLMMNNAGPGVRRHVKLASTSC